MFNASRNARVRRSLDRTAAAFLSLLKDEEYVKITVSQLSSLAGITRKTYYRNFLSMDDVVDYVVFKAVREYLRTTGCTSISEYLGRFFAFCLEQRDIFTLLHKRGLFGLLSFGLSRYVSRSAYLDKELIASGLSQPEIDLFWGSLFGAEVNLLHYWIEEDWRSTPEEMAMALEKGFKNILKASIWD